MALIDYLKDRRILAFIIILVVLGALDYRYGIHLGVEFAGGTQIPIALEQSVTADQMNQLITILQQRLSTFGLRQVTIEGIGNSQVQVIVPSVSQNDIASTISIIDSQGVFQGIVNGRVALNGSAILGDSVGAGPPTVSGGNVSWAVNFYVTPQGANQFAKVAFGQTNKPLYMYLDRPNGAIVLLNSSLLGTTTIGTTAQQEISALQQSVAFGNRTIPIEILNPGASNWPSLYKFFAANNKKYNQVILLNTTPTYIKSNLTSLNYTLSFKNSANMTPVIINVANTSITTQLQVESWPAVGLLSSQVLNSGVTNGSTQQGYIISGSAPPTLPTLQARINNANNQSKLL